MKTKEGKCLKKDQNMNNKIGINTKVVEEVEEVMVGEVAMEMEKVMEKVEEVVVEAVEVEAVEAVEVEMEMVILIIQTSNSNMFLDLLANLLSNKKPN